MSAQEGFRLSEGDSETLSRRLDEAYAAYTLLLARIFQSLGAEGASPEYGAVAKYILNTSSAPVGLRPLLDCIQFSNNTIAGRAFDYAQMVLRTWRRGGDIDIAEVVSNLETYHQDFLEFFASSKLSDDHKCVAKVDEIAKTLCDLIKVYNDMLPSDLRVGPSVLVQGPEDLVP